MVKTASLIITKTEVRKLGGGGGDLMASIILKIVALHGDM
jgi:hypothetical protein